MQPLRLLANLPLPTTPHPANRKQCVSLDPSITSVPSEGPAPGPRELSESASPAQWAQRSAPTSAASAAAAAPARCARAAAG